jgi:hypothetical protein
MSYNSAKEAIDSLSIGQKLDKRLAQRKIREVAKAMGIKMIGGHLKFSEALFYVFKNHLRMFSKSIRLAQVNGTDNIVIYSDVYHIEKSDLKIIHDMQVAGVILHPFVKRYPELQFKDGHVHNGKLYNDGYDKYYRGILHGIII